MKIKLLFRKCAIVSMSAFLGVLAFSQATVSLVAGNSNGNNDGTGSNARFYHPTTIIRDGSGNFLVADYLNNIIRKVTPSGVVTTAVGYTTSPGYQDGTIYNALFNGPYSMAYDSSGNIYVADTGNHKIRKISTNGNVTTLAGSTPGYVDATGTNAKFKSPKGILLDSYGNVYVTDDNHVVRKISPSGVVTTLAGSTYGDQDGTNLTAKFAYPLGMKFDGSGNIYLADTGNHKIKKISSTGVVSTVAGTTDGFLDGAANVAQFSFPYAIETDGLGNIFIADMGNHRIRKLSADGVVSTNAGSVSGYAEGNVSVAKFQFPQALTLDYSGDLYVADTYNNRIRKITFETLGVSDIVNQNLMVYPNPANDFVTVVGDFMNKAGEYILTSVDGKQVGKGFVTEGSSKIDVGHLIKGNYFLTLRSGDQFKTIKIIKN